MSTENSKILHKAPDVALRNTRGYHVVQIGYDDSVFSRESPSDTFERQLLYGAELSRIATSTVMTYVVLTKRAGVVGFREGNVSFIPVYVPRLRNVGKLLSVLQKVHKSRPINVIAASSVQEDAWIALFFGWQKKIPVIGQLHYDFFSDIARAQELGTGLTNWLRYQLAYSSIKRCVAMRVVGEAIERKVRRKRLSEQVYTIPVPVTMQAVSKAKPRLSGSPPHVMFVGRLCPPKNLLLWLEVAKLVRARIPNVVFDIVGDGPLRTSLEQKAQHRGLSQFVRFHGAVAYEQLQDYYRNGDVFLLTSSNEGFGRVLVESYLNFVPAVATRGTGIEDIIQHGTTGYLAPVNDASSFAEYVVQLLQNPHLRHQMAEKGNAYVRAKFDPDELRRRWCSLLIDVASKQYVRRATVSRRRRAA